MTAKNYRPLSPEMIELLSNLKAAGKPILARQAYPRHSSSARLKLACLAERGYAVIVDKQWRDVARAQANLWTLTPAGAEYLVSPPPPKTTCDTCNERPRMKHKRDCAHCKHVRAAIRAAQVEKRAPVMKRRGERCNCGDDQCNGMRCERVSA